MPTKRQPGFLQAVVASALIVGILFLVRGVETAFHLPLERFGIIPRNVYGLPGILFSPLLHANLDHLIANSVPLFVLLILLLANPEYHPWRTLAMIWIASGCGIWLIGRGNATHIGASSVIFGLAAFLIMAGFYAKSWRSVFVAVLFSSAMAASSTACCLNPVRSPGRGTSAAPSRESGSQGIGGVESFQESRYEKFGLRQSPHDERAIPIREEVKGACEILGLDPLYVANEGKLLAFVPPHEAGRVLAALRSHPLGEKAAVIGQVVPDHPGMVTMKTRVGGHRIVDMFSGEQLPRIC